MKSWGFSHMRKRWIPGHFSLLPRGLSTRLAYIIHMQQQINYISLKKKQGGPKCCASHPLHQGGRTSTKNRVKKLSSILRYAENSQQFTAVKQVSTCSIQVCWGTNGDQCLEHFVLRVKHPYIFREVGEILGYG